MRYLKVAVLLILITGFLSFDMIFTRHVKKQIDFQNEQINIILKDVSSLKRLVSNLSLQQLALEALKLPEVATSDPPVGVRVGKDDSSQ